MGSPLHVRVRECRAADSIPAGEGIPRGVGEARARMKNVSLIFAHVAISNNALFNEWHWAAVYQYALQYGKSFPEMFKALSSKRNPQNLVSVNSESKTKGLTND